MVHVLHIMRNFEDQNFIEDIKYACEKLHSVDHDSLVNFTLSYCYENELDLALVETTAEVTETNESVEADIKSLDKIANLYSMDYECEEELSSWSVAYIASTLITQFNEDDIITSVKLNETNDKVIEAKCGCNFAGLLYCSHVVHVLEQTDSTIHDYHKLKTAVASIAHDSLVTIVISLLSNNNVPVELGFQKHLGKDIISNWMNEASKMKSLDFLDDVNGVQEELNEVVGVIKTKKKESYHRRHMYDDSSDDSSGDDFYHYHFFGNHMYHPHHPRLRYDDSDDDMDSDDMDSDDDDVQLTDVKSGYDTLVTKIRACCEKVGQFIEAGDFDFAFKLLYSLTEHIKRKTSVDVDNSCVLSSQDVEEKWVKLFQTAPLTPEECLEWAEKMNPYISINSTGFRNAQSAVMARYSVLIDNEEHLDEFITQALEDAEGKFGEAKLIGFAKGANSRGLNAASFLLCLKVLTIPNVSRMQTDVAVKTRTEAIMLMCKVLEESNKSAPAEEMNGVESLFRISARSATKYSFKMDLSTLFATLTSVTPDILASILVEFTVLAARDFVQQGPEIFKLAEGLTKAKKPRQAFEVGILAHSRPGSIGQAEIANLFDMGLASNSAKLRQRLVMACLESYAKHAYTLALKAAKVDLNDHLENKDQKVIPFICDILPAIANDSEVYPGIAELVFTVELNEAELLMLKKKLDELNLHKSSLFVAERLAERSNNMDNVSEFVLMCAKMDDQKLASRLLKRQISNQREGTRLFAIAKTLTEHERYPLAWEVIVRACTFQAENTRTLPYNYMPAHMQRHISVSEKQIQMCELAISIARKIPNFDPMNAVNLLSDVMDPNTVMKFVQEYQTDKPEDLRIVFELCKLEFDSVCFYAVNFNHCPHSACKKCEKVYEGFAEALYKLLNFGYLVGNEEQTRAGIKELKQYHHSKKVMMNKVDSTLQQGIYPSFKLLRQKFQQNKLSYIVPTHTIVHPPLELPSRKLVPFATPSNSAISSRNRLRSLQTELHNIIKIEEKGALHMHYPMRTVDSVRNQIQQALDSLRLVYHDTDEDVETTTKYTKYISNNQQQPQQQTQQQQPQQPQQQQQQPLSHFQYVTDQLAHYQKLLQQMDSDYNFHAFGQKLLTQQKIKQLQKELLKLTNKK